MLGDLFKYEEKIWSDTANRSEAVKYSDYEKD